MESMWGVNIIDSGLLRSGIPLCITTNYVYKYLSVLICVTSMNPSLTQ